MADRARVAVVISGEGSNMAALLYASRLPDTATEIVLVASNNPDAAGLALAEAEGVPTWSLSHKGLTREAFDDALDDALTAARPDAVALAGYMRLLTPAFVARWRGRLLNIHPSLLPKYRGLDTYARALDAGDSHAGCTVHLVTEDVDAGEILGQVAVAIRPGDTPDTLAARVRLAEHQLYPATLAAYVSRFQDAAWIEARLDELASPLPEVSRKTSHGSPGWAVGSEKSAKLFAILADRHHGEDAIGLLVKASGADEMTGLIEARPDTYYWPKYYGASGWLGFKLNRRDTDWDEVGEWLQRSWRACAPPRLTRLMRAADEF
ncbi:phosphoribosylglycinamide formyltransferase-1 [Sphingomonas kaistensis]|uniref:Phosphoribosylglycinamide formyltransferase n=1 Tax=Sphingomonas kaistensis TaxID=298708 RepID=A0A7X5Y8Q0_9SPHN|nr:phosphoribosylglycinamide formyltransferase [Sphingomonas kaistensis]NJC05935.1 phosphoribosylglycinamide formyltransferase-1 [Sphingomonas kaistensis]